MSSTEKSPQTLAERTGNTAAEIVRTLVQHPDQVAMEVLQPDQGQPVLLIKVAPEDVGVFLTHEGRTLRALRTFVNAMAAKNGLPVKLQIEAIRQPPGPTLA